MEDELEFRMTNPADEDLNTFESGVEEVNNYFRSRAWFKYEKGAAAPPTYTFLNEDERVGYAAISFGKCPHPHDQSKHRKKYLVIYVVGIDVTYQGVKREQTGASYASAIFNTLVRFARESDSCVGLSLWVRSDNDGPSRSTRRSASWRTKMARSRVTTGRLI